MKVMVGLVAVTGAAALIPSGAMGAAVTNGNFETGSFKGWKKDNVELEVMDPLRGGLPLPSTEWRIYDKNSRVPSGSLPMDRKPLDRGLVGTVKLPKPKGKFSSYIDVWGPGSNVLYQTIKIPNDAKKLQLQVFWNNQGGIWAHDGTFLKPEGDEQFFSIDLLDAGADPRSEKGKDVAAHIFSPKLSRTMSGRTGRRAATPTKSKWKKLSVNVKTLRGDNVTFRLAEVDNVLYNYVGIDNVKVVK